MCVWLCAVVFLCVCLVSISVLGSQKKSTNSLTLELQAVMNSPKYPF